MRRTSNPLRASLNEVPHKIIQTRPRVKRQSSTSGHGIWGEWACLPQGLGVGCLLPLLALEGRINLAIGRSDSAKIVLGEYPHAVLTSPGVTLDDT